jgi:hypothetical protein
MITAMTELTTALLTVAAAVVVALAAVRYIAFVKSDGYGRRSASGFVREWKPRDWASRDLPSTPYQAKPHF